MPEQNQMLRSMNYLGYLVVAAMLFAAVAMCISANMSPRDVQANSDDPEAMFQSYLWQRVGLASFITAAVVGYSCDCFVKQKKGR